MRHAVTAAVLGLMVAGGVALALQREEPPLATEFPLRMAAGVRLRGTDLAIDLVRIANDSRCPVEARCVTAGDAEVVLSVRRGRAATRAVTLHTIAASREAIVGGWRVQLVDLAPQPSLRQPLTQKDYVATLRVDPVR